MANCLDEISLQEGDSNGEQILSNNKWQKLQQVHQQSGFREGVSSSRESHMQEGFVSGFRSSLKHSVTIGYMKGLISPYQQEGLKDSKADDLHAKLEQMKQANMIDYTHAATCNDDATIEDIIKEACDKNNSVYLQCKTLQNQS